MLSELLIVMFLQLLILSMGANSTNNTPQMIALFVSVLVTILFMYDKSLSEPNATSEPNAASEANQLSEPNAPSGPNELSEPIITPGCEDGIVYNLQADETLDDITDTYQRSLTMTPVLELRNVGDSDYCVDTDPTEVCSRYTKTCRDPTTREDVVRSAQVKSTSGTTFACEIRNCIESVECASEYGPWSPCTTNCGPNGTRKRSKCGWEDDSSYDQIESCNTEVECKPGCTGNNTLHVVRVYVVLRWRNSHKIQLCHGRIGGNELQHTSVS